MAARMIRSLSFVTLMAATASAAVAQGPIDTVLRGHYVCELPGDAATQAGIPQPGRNFTIESSSRYSAPQGAGVYLRRGESFFGPEGQPLTEGRRRPPRRDRPAG